jgi:hypothetical protein
MSVVHMKAYLLDYVGNARPGEGEVVKGLDLSLVGSRVTDRGTCVREYLGLSVHRHVQGLQLVIPAR